MKEEKNKSIQDQINKYEKEYVRYENFKFVKYILIIVFGIFVVFIANFVLTLCFKAFDINVYLGYITIAFCIIFIIFIFIVPLIKLFSANEFRLNVKKYGKENLNKHNDKICYIIAKGIIDFNKKLPEAKWYDSELVSKLEVATKDKSIEDVRDILSDLMNTTIRNNSNNIIVNYSVKAGLFSALSQSDKLDAILIFIVDLFMIKDLVFLYGFRPTIVKMIKIYISVFASVATAYGLQASNVGKGIFKSVFSMIKGLLGGVSTVAAGVSVNPTSAPVSAPIAILAKTAQQFLGTLGDSTVQGMSNGVITAMLGYQTIAHLNEEYKLQDNLKNIDLLDDDKEFKNTCKDIQNKLKKEQDKKGE